MTATHKNVVRAFVAGATGYTGRAVVELLRECGIETAAHVRLESSSLEAHTARFEGQGAIVIACAWQLEALREALAQVQPTHVFCLIGTTRSRARDEGVSGDIYEAVDYALSSMLIRASVECGVSPKFVYLSSMGVGVHEPKNAYLRARYKVEQELASSGLKWVSARPSFITGDRDEVRPMESVGALFADAMLGTASFFGARRWAAKYRSQTGSELARALVSLALDDGIVGTAVESDGLVARH